MIKRLSALRRGELETALETSLLEQRLHTQLVALQPNSRE